MSWKAALASLVLGGFLLFGATPARADNCSDKIRKEGFKLERDIARHGVFSRQAEHRRSKMRELRERCFFERRHGRWDRDDRFHGRHSRWDRRDHDARWQRHDRDHRWRRWPDRDR